MAQCNQWGCAAETANESGYCAEHPLSGRASAVLPPKPLYQRQEEAREHSEKMVEGIFNEAVHQAFCDDPKERLTGFLSESRSVIILDGIDNVEVVIDNNGIAIVCTDGSRMTTIVINGPSSSTPR